MKAAKKPFVINVPKAAYECNMVAIFFWMRTGKITGADQYLKQ
jgi:hypothetical protein